MSKYHEDQINEIISGDDYPEYGVQIVLHSHYGATKWLTLTPEAFEKIKQILTEMSQ